MYKCHSNGSCSGKLDISKTLMVSQGGQKSLMSHKIQISIIQANLLTVLVLLVGHIIVASVQLKYVLKLMVLSR